MKQRVFARNVILRALPVLAAMIVASIHPALAVQGGGNGALAGVQTAATNMENALLGVGFAAAIIGIGTGAIHWAGHRDDWAGAATRTLAGIIGGVIVANAPALAAVGGGVLF
ncbi:MAG: hypothetical protein NVS4B5_21390 [Vulcanimicrobiaceae bacterium]